MLDNVFLLNKLDSFAEECDKKNYLSESDHIVGLMEWMNTHQEEVQSMIDRAVEKLSRSKASGY